MTTFFDRFTSSEKLIDQREIKREELIDAARQLQNERKDRYEKKHKPSWLAMFGLVGLIPSLIKWHVAKKHHARTEQNFAENILHLDRRVVLRAAEVKKPKKTLESKIG